MIDFKDISKIDGWLTGREAHLLYSLSRDVDSLSTIVEIGSWKGRSTLCLGMGSKDGHRARVYAIDPHTGSSEHIRTFGKVDTFAEFTGNIQNSGFADLISPIRKSSKEAAFDFDCGIGLLFIDGAHEFRHVREDFILWFSKVIEGGNVAFHDSWHFLGPNTVSAWVACASFHVKNPRLVDTITVFEKVKQNSIIDRLWNIVFILYRTLFGIIGFWRIKRRMNFDF